MSAITTVESVDKASSLLMSMHLIRITQNE